VRGKSCHDTITPHLLVVFFFFFFTPHLLVRALVAVEVIRTLVIINTFSKLIPAGISETAFFPALVFMASVAFAAWAVWAWATRGGPGAVWLRACGSNLESKACPSSSNLLRRAPPKGARSQATRLTRASPPDGQAQPDAQDTGPMPAH